MSATSLEERIRFLEMIAEVQLRTIKALTNGIPAAEEGGATALILYLSRLERAHKALHALHNQIAGHSAARPPDSDLSAALKEAGDALHYLPLPR